MAGVILLIISMVGFLAGYISMSITELQKEEEKPAKNSPNEKPTENIPIVTEVRTLPIETLLASKAYPAALVKSEMEGPGHGSNLYNMATKALAEQIADNLIPYLEIESDYDVVNQVQVYYARLKVIKPK